MITKLSSRRGRPLSPLRVLLGSETRAKTLTHFVLHPDEAFHVRQLERLLREPAGNLLRDLRRLHAITLLEADRIGNQVRYRLRSVHPLYPELQRLILKTVAADIVLKETLSPLKGIELALLYGSFVKGEATTQSDLDLLVIGETPEAELASAVARGEEILGRQVSYMRYTRTEARRKARLRDSFLQRVLAGPTVVFLGSVRDELFQIARG